MDPINIGASLMALVFGVFASAAQADDLSVGAGEKAQLDAFSGTQGRWIRVSDDIVASDSGGARTVIYRNDAVKLYLARLEARIDAETRTLARSKDHASRSDRARFIDSLIEEAEALAAELRLSTQRSKGTEIVGWDQGTGCGWILYADAEFNFSPNLVNSAYVTSSFDQIGSGPQFGPPPPQLPTRMYRHVRATIDNASTGSPINVVDSTRGNSGPIQVTALDTNFWGDACVLTSTRTVSLRGGSCGGGYVQMVAVTTRNCSDL